MSFKRGSTVSKVPRTSPPLAGEHSHASSRVVFLTDLCSTVDSANDEKRLLNTIKTNADRGIYTTVVGIGMVGHWTLQLYYYCHLCMCFPLN